MGRALDLFGEKAWMEDGEIGMVDGSDLLWVKYTRDFEFGAQE